MGDFFSITHFFGVGIFTAPNKRRLVNESVGGSVVVFIEEK